MHDASHTGSDLVPVRNLGEIRERVRQHEAEIRALHATALFVYGDAARDALTIGGEIDVFIDYDRDGPFSFVEWVAGADVLKSILGHTVSFTTRDGLDHRQREEIEASAVRVI